VTNRDSVYARSTDDIVDNVNNAKTAYLRSDAPTTSRRDNVKGDVPAGARAGSADGRELCYSLGMTLILRTMDKHAQLMGWGHHWGDDDYVILDGERSVGRIHKDTTSPRWIGRSIHRRFPRHLRTMAWLQRWTKLSSISKPIRRNEGTEIKAVRMKTYAIYKFAAKVALLGYINAKTEEEAIETASKEFKVEARLLRAYSPRWRFVSFAGTHVSPLKPHKSILSSDHEPVIN
jgi:hypothetical protein